MQKTKQDGKVYSALFNGWHQSISLLLTETGLVERLQKERLLIIKPNLVEPLRPPVTTPVQCVAALVDSIRDISPHVEIVVAEGSGSNEYDTPAVFAELGFTEWAGEAGIKLLDLNQESLVKLHCEDCRRWPEMYLPEIVFEGFLLSVPVLKAHTLAQVTLTMKNMMGLAPPSHYQQKGYWKKAAFHQQIHEAVYDLNRYRTPDFTIIDATVGMQTSHLRGPTCNPPRNKLVAGYDPVAVDVFGAELLGLDWRNIGHLHMANGVLGKADPLEIVELV